MSFRLDSIVFVLKRFCLSDARKSSDNRATEFEVVYPDEIDLQGISDKGKRVREKKLKFSMCENELFACFLSGAQKTSFHQRVLYLSSFLLHPLGLLARYCDLSGIECERQKGKPCRGEGKKEKCLSIAKIDKLSLFALCSKGPFSTLLSIPVPPQKQG